MCVPILAGANQTVHSSPGEPIVSHVAQLCTLRSAQGTNIHNLSGCMYAVVNHTPCADRDYTHSNYVSVI